MKPDVSFRLAILPLLWAAGLCCGLTFERAAWAAATHAATPTTNRTYAAHVSVMEQNPPAPPRLGEPINDLALGQYLETEGRKLVERGATLSNWADRLTARATVLKLPAPSARQREPARAVHAIERAVGVVGTFYLCSKCSKLHLSSASGFFLTEGGALATCLHVLAGYRTNGVGLVVLTRDGRVCPVRAVLACDPLHDLVVLQVEGRGFTPLALRKEDAPPGTPIVVVSNPSQHYYAVSTGIVARQGQLNRPGGLYRFLSVTADFAKGSSGAPVCDATGAVVGIVDNTQSIYYSVEHDRQQNLQMTVKNCSPVTALRKLVSQP
jgi:S1-C subfamily serine protease